MYLILRNLYRRKVVGKNPSYQITYKVVPVFNFKEVVSDMNEEMQELIKNLEDRLLHMTRYL